MKVQKNLDVAFMAAGWGKDWRHKHDLGRGYATWDWIVAASWVKERPHLTGIAQHIQAHLFHEVEAAQIALDARLGEHERSSGRSVVKLQYWYRMVVLQDAVFQRPLHPRVYEHFPLWDSPVFTEWFEQVWTPHVLALHEQGLQRLRVARDRPVGGMQLQEMLAVQGERLMQSWQAELQKLGTAAHNLVPGSPTEHVDHAVIMRSVEKLRQEMQAASDAAHQQSRPQEEPPASASDPVAQLDFSAADSPKVPFSNSQSPHMLWKELTIGLHDGSVPLLDHLDLHTFNLQQGFSWAEPPGKKPSGYTRKAWGAKKHAILEIFRRCNPALRGSDLHAQGLPTLQLMQQAMQKQNCHSVETFYKKRNEPGSAWSAFQQLAL